MSLLAAASGVGLLWFRQNQARHCRLADGTELRLEKVEFNRAPNFNPRSPWKEKLFRRTPARFHYLFGPPNTASHITFRKDTLTLWVTHYDPAKRTWLDQTWNNDELKVELLDKHGCVFSCEDSTKDYQGKFSISAFHFASFPRRQKTIHLRFRKGATVLGEIEINNPAFKRYPEWTPDALPNAQLDGEFTFLVRPLRPDGPSRLNSDPESHFKFDTLRDGKPDPDWMLGEATFIDATGNIGTHLCPYEGAWKVEASLYRRPNHDFATNEVWKINGLQVPHAGEFTVVETTNTWNEAAVKFLGVSGNGRYTFARGHCTKAEPWDNSMGSEPRRSGLINSPPYVLTSPNPRLVCYLSLHNPLLTLLIHVADDKGFATDISIPPGRKFDFEFYATELSFHPEAKTFSVEFVAERPRFTSAFVKPPEQ